jgi:hypothetical protein
MVRAFVPYPVTGHRAHAFGRNLLKLALEVAGPPLHDLPDHILEARDDEPAGDIETAVEVEGTDDGFVSIREDGLLLPAPGHLFALAEQDVLVKAHAP